MDDRDWQRNQYYCMMCNAEMEKSEELDVEECLSYQVARCPEGHGSWRWLKTHDAKKKKGGGKEAAP